MSEDPKDPGRAAWWERRRRSFEAGADAYDRYRPDYPEVLFDDIRVYADLAPDDAIFEIGCGTGRATIHYARWGNPIVAIEPSPAMADVARSNLAEHPNVDVRVARFEDEAFDRGSYGLVTGAQVYHWLDRETRDERIANLLYAHGTVALVDNVQVNPEETLPFFVRVQDVYLDIAPRIAHQGEFRKPHDVPTHRLDGTTRFADLEQRTYPWQWTLSTDDYIGLMQTASPHASLDPETRARLMNGIAELIDAEFGGHVTEHYVAMADLGRRA